MPTLAVRHLTRYRYAKPVRLGEHRMMFRPREGHDQRILQERLVITPEPTVLRFMHDVFGNCVAFARFGAPTDQLTFESFVELDHRPEAPDHEDAAAVPFPAVYSREDAPDLLRSMERDHPDPERRLERWARRFADAHGAQGALAVLSAMTRAVHAEFGYNCRLEVGTQTPLETLRLGTGSCRDFAVLMIEAARCLNIAARFVSGYVYSEADGGTERVGGGHTHAWLQAYLPHCGWVEFDPTNGIVGNSDLIRVAVARDPRQALPLSGTWYGDAADYLGMDVEVDVTALNLAARRLAA